MNEYVVIAGRALLSFIILFSLARMLGKKQISQLTFFDYVVGIAIGTMAASIAINTSIKYTYGIIGLIVYSIMSLLISFGALKSFKFRDLVESSPSILIKDGKILEENLAKHKMTFDDLLNGLRVKSAFNVSEVELAMLETDGQISVMKKPEYQALTPKDIGLSVEADHAPSLIIIDGTLLEKRLNYLGYKEEWLLTEIKKKGATTIKDVFLAQINSNGTVYVDLYDDKKKFQQNSQKQELASRLRKIQADIESIATQTSDNNAKNMYYTQSIELDNMIKKLNPVLKE
ncbi:DUF421 domain-containing protein [Metabacillus malikii]|uniref:Uncharacterized membrane protein YcaP (DUF421 family) n=1 Tax=Metabacillus malikii TaxID=1504265 RepID=A0ABT9ZIJ2_9BACI|nr:DUF421 domain-containing protein [Metabacillus malikii]MDQ0232088.1 uncharacterized membrane protein YcaP (DUF421 family) [Metabacillus malikii]